MENTEIQKANATSENNDKKTKTKTSGCTIAVMPPWGTATGNTTKENKENNAEIKTPPPLQRAIQQRKKENSAENKRPTRPKKSTDHKKNRLVTHRARLDFFYIIRITTEGENMLIRAKSTNYAIIETAGTKDPSLSVQRRCSACGSQCCVRVCVNFALHRRRIFFLLIHN